MTTTYAANLGTATHMFGGFGGDAQGLAEAGWTPVWAGNHWDVAMETHAANHPQAEHVCADLSNYDMRRLPRTQLLWASPICTEGSPAGGNKRRRREVAGQLAIEELGHVPQAAMVRTRATFMDVIRAVEVRRYDAVIVENVPEVAEEWELFDWWVDGMCKLGYNVQFVSVSSAHIGGPDNPYAPQWRDRLYVVFTRTGIPLPDVAPRPLAWCKRCDENVHAEQAWPDGRRIGRYAYRQYNYVCPACRLVVEPYVAPGSVAIDWSDLGTRIGDRKRTKARPEGLAPSTIRRIREGLRLVMDEPILVHVNHDGDGRPRPVSAGPLATRTAKIGDGIATPSFLVPSGGTWRTDASPLVHPMPTRTTRETDGVVIPPFITELRGGGSSARPTAHPLATVTAGGNHHYLTVPPGSFVIKNYGGNCDPRNTVVPIDGPLSTVTTKDHHALVIPYRKGRAKTTADPIHTLSTRESAAVCHPAPAIEDCRYRMLKPREQLAAQRFPAGYVVYGNIGEQTMGAGNAVSCNVAHWLGKQVAEVLS